MPLAVMAWGQAKTYLRQLYPMVFTHVQAGRTNTFIKLPDNRRLVGARDDHSDFGFGDFVIDRTDRHS